LGSFELPGGQSIVGREGAGFDLSSSLLLKILYVQFANRAKLRNTEALNVLYEKQDVIELKRPDARRES